MKSNKGVINTRTLALSSSFAALYAILRTLPTFPMLGVSGSFFALGDIVAPLFGIILGPAIGPLAIIVGTILAYPIHPPVFLFLDFLPAAMNALVLGLLMRRRWIVSVAIYAVLLALFIMHPLSLRTVTIGGVQVPFHWMHIIALIILISPLGRKSAGWLTKKDPVEESANRLSIGGRLAAGVLVMAFIGTFVQHSTGSILWETIHGMVLGVLGADAFYTIWGAIFWVYPFERVFLIVMATIVGVASVGTLKSAGLLLTARESTKEA